MPIVFSCECGKRFSVDEKFVGKRGQCKACGKSILIPSVSEQPVEKVLTGAIVNEEYTVQSPDATERPADIPAAKPADAKIEADYEFSDVYAEIEKQVNRRTSWTTTAVILVVSCVAFWAFGLSVREWTSLLLMVGLIFLHELGHLAAMRMFKYRNLRMFFIPFFGAAATGQNYNVPGWKQGVVSLAGPLPGMALGAILGFIAIAGHCQTLMAGAFMLLGINAFNLLPILPLDGGQMMHAVLFSRHPMLNVAFRAIACVVLLLGFLISWIGMGLLGLFMLIRLSVDYHIAKVAHKLRKCNFDACSHDDQTIPFETARRIHDELVPYLPSRSTPKISASLTLQTFELLNAKPPGWLISAALIAVQGISFFLALVMMTLLYVAMRQ